MKKVLFKVELNERNLHRRDHLVKQLKKYVNLSECTFLEVGIGNGRFGFLLGDKVKRYCGIDIDQEYITLAEKNIPEGADAEYKVGRAEEIPFNEKFDVILYALSWHFIEDFNKAMDEAKRILKDMGVIAIIEPSEKTKEWASKKLRTDSPEFREDLCKKKLANIQEGKKVIRAQRVFSIVQEEYDEKTTSNIWILKKK